jgi:hypothetical protein
MAKPIVAGNITNDMVLFAFLSSAFISPTASPQFEKAGNSTLIIAVLILSVVNVESDLPLS